MFSALYYLVFVNNVYFRYHRTLKDVGLNSRLSLGMLIGNILKVNRVQIRKSKHADFDQQLKVHTRVPDVLQSFAHTVSPYILRHMMEQHEKSINAGFSLLEVWRHIHCAQGRIPGMWLICICVLYSYNILHTSKFRYLFSIIFYCEVTRALKQSLYC